jgi:hypothetical protein
MKSGSPDETIFVHIPRLLNFVCSKCGSRDVKVRRSYPPGRNDFSLAGRLVGAKKNPASFPAGEALDMEARRTRQRPASSGSRLDHLRFMELCCSPDLWPMKADRRSCRSTVSKSGLMGGGGRTQGTQQKLARCRCRAGLRSLLAIPGTRRRRSPANRWLDL